MSHDTAHASAASSEPRKPSVLFVDDETRILDGLRRTLHPRRAIWDLRFAGGGLAAIEAMEETPADLIVSDMRMPGMDGAALLATLRERWPACVRVVLSGQSDTSAGLESARAVHQFLHKPCEPHVLEAVIEQASRIARLVPDPRRRALAGSLGSLAARPGSRAALERIVAHPQASAEQALPVILTDAALAAKVLQLTGTSFFTRPRPFVNLETSVAGLGIEALRSLAASHVFVSDPAAESALGPWLEEHHARTVRAARAQEPPPGPTLGGVSYLRGLFSDLGALIVASATGSAPAPGAAEDASSARMLGAYLLGIWGISPTVVDAVAADAAGEALGSGWTRGADSLAA